MESNIKDNFEKRVVDSDTKPASVEWLQGKMLVNVLVEEEVVEDGEDTSSRYKWLQLLLDEGSDLDTVLSCVNSVYEEKLHTLEMSSMSAIRAGLLDKMKPEDEALLEEVSGERERLEAELVSSIVSITTLLSTDKQGA